MSSSPSTIDCPLRRARRERLAAAICGALAVCAAGIWAFTPVSNSDDLQSVTASDPIAPSEAPATPMAFATKAFNAHLWVDPPAPAVFEQPPEPKPTPPPPPLRLTLVAILSEPDGLIAALYDEEADELRLVPVGTSLGGTQVTAIDAAGVTIRSNGREQRLALIREGGR